MIDERLPAVDTASASCAAPSPSHRRTARCVPLAALQRPGRWPRPRQAAAGGRAARGRVARRAPESRGIAEVRRARRFRHRQARAVRARRADGQGPRALPVRAGDHRRRQPLWIAAAAGLPDQVRGAVQGAARRRREVLRVARAITTSAKQRYYKLFNMDGKLYYSFKAPKQNVRFFALDSTYPDPAERAGSRKSSRAPNEDWKIPYFHHPLYSSGERHGSTPTLRDGLGAAVREVRRSASSSRATITSTSGPSRRKASSTS